MTTLKEQQELFTILGKYLKEKIECFVIGGSAMLYYGAKDVTKDIDIVFINEESREKIIKILKSLGFINVSQPKRKLSTKIYKN